MASYGSQEGVIAIVPALGTIDEQSTPSSWQIEDWLTEGYSEINRALAGAGYTIPASRSAALWPSLRALNDLYVAAYALRARGLDVVEGREESRSEEYLADFRRRLKELVEQDLTALGLSVRATPSAPKRRRVRSLQMRRVDGYSGVYGGSAIEYENTSE